VADDIGAIDQGTTGTRSIVFGRDRQIVAADQRAHERINPCAGWAEHDPLEIVTRTREVIDAVDVEVSAIGITNQRSLDWVR
jgi:glycerol kinase